MVKEDSICSDISQGLNTIVEKIYTLALPEKKKRPAGDYWSEWAFQMEDEPIFTRQIDSNYIGVGWFMPNELAGEEGTMSYDEWLLNHGLQLSIGIGETNGSLPRVRVDYRWSQAYDADVMLQLEVPF